MAQFVTTLNSSSCGMSFSVSSCSVKPTQKLSSCTKNYGKVSSFIGTGSSLIPLSRNASAFPRISLKKLHRIRCSASSAAGGQQGNVIEVEDEESVDKYIQEAGNKLVVIDISTTTCGPCKLIYPKVVKMSIEYPDALFLKINGDRSSNTRALMRKWGVRAVPNFRFYRSGELLHSHSGANEDELRAYFITHYMSVESVAS
eukprot:Gb_20154 [translate_table: standard]